MTDIDQQIQFIEIIRENFDNNNREYVLTKYTPTQFAELVHDISKTLHNVKMGLALNEPKEVEPAPEGTSKLIITVDKAHNGVAKRHIDLKQVNMSTYELIGLIELIKIDLTEISKLRAKDKTL